MRKNKCEVTKNNLLVEHWFDQFWTDMSWLAVLLKWLVSLFVYDMILI